MKSAQRERERNSLRVDFPYYHPMRTLASSILCLHEDLCLVSDPHSVTLDRLSSSITLSNPPVLCLQLQFHYSCRLFLLLNVNKPSQSSRFNEPGNAPVLKNLAHFRVVHSLLVSPNIVQQHMWMCLTEVFVLNFLKLSKYFQSSFEDRQFGCLVTGIFVG